MKKVIHKFTIDGPKCTIWMMEGSQILTVQAQNDQICLWVKTKECGHPVERHFFAINTGDEFDPSGLEYLGTVLLKGGKIVKHVFEII